MSLRDFDALWLSRLRYIRPFVVLVSCLVVCILNIKMHLPENQAFGRILITIVVFYVIGTVAQNMIHKIVMEAEQTVRQRQEEAEKEAKRQQNMVPVDEDEEEQEENRQDSEKDNE